MTSTRLTVHPRASLALLWATWASIALAAPAHADHVIGPGQEPHVLALFAPSGMGQEVVTGYLLTAVVIRPREIELSLEEARPSAPAAATVVVRLVGRDSPLPEGMVAIAESASFALVVDREVAATRRAALLQLAERVRGNDDGDFWTEVATVQTEPVEPDESVGFGPLLRYVALAAAIAALMVAVWARRRASRHVE